MIPRPRRRFYCVLMINLLRWLSHSFCQVLLRTLTGLYHSKELTPSFVSDLRCATRVENALSTAQGMLRQSRALRVDISYGHRRLLAP